MKSKRLYWISFGRLTVGDFVGPSFFYFGSVDFCVLLFFGPGVLLSFADGCFVIFEASTCGGRIGCGPPIYCIGFGLWIGILPSLGIICMGCLWSIGWCGYPFGPTYYIFKNRWTLLIENKLNSRDDRYWIFWWKIQIKKFYWIKSTYVHLSILGTLLVVHWL